MSTPLYELLKIAVSDAYKQDPSIFDVFLKKVSSLPGVNDIWTGPEVQDEQYLYLVVKWSFRDPEYDASDVKAELEKLSKELVFVHFVHFSAPVDAALGAPILEIATFDVKETTDTEGYLKKLTPFHKQIKATLPDDVTLGGYGRVEGKPRTFVVFIGWQSMEGFGKVLENEDLLAAAKELQGPVEFGIKHARLTKYLARH